MCLLRLLGVALIVVVARINADCPYAAEIKRLDPCSSKQGSPLFDVGEVRSVRLTGENCDIELTGCLTLKRKVESMTCRWTATKNGMPVHKGEKNICGLQTKKLKLKCPMKKGTNICTKDDSVDIPMGKVAFMTLTGNLAAEVVCTSGGVQQCMKGTGRIYKK